MAARQSALIWGHHGVGKSQAVKQFCEENEMGFVDLRLGTQEVGDLLGLAEFKLDPVTGEKIATKFMQPDWLPTDPDSKGIIFLDEINRARRDVLQAVFQLVLDRRIHTYELPKGWHVIAASNPNTEGYIVADIGDKAFMDRFCHIQLHPTTDEFLRYAEDKDFDRDVINFIRTNTNMLQEPMDEITVIQDRKPSRRSWEAVHRLKKCETPFNVFQELCYGLVGNAATIAFIESMKNSDKPFSAEEVLNKYNKISDKVKEYGDSSKNEGGRFDLLKATCDNLQARIDKVEANGETLDKAQRENIAAFCKDLPIDISFSIIRELYLIESLRDTFDNDKGITKIITKARKDLKE
jgi:alkaline phosphatase D